jgi:hypothetical protein
VSDGGGGRFEVRFDGFVWREVDDEIILLEMETGSYLNLNGSARVLWNALAESASEEELSAALVEAFGVDHDQATSDARAFLAELSRRSMIQPVA